MQFTTTQTQTTLKALTHQVFDIHSPKSAAAKKAQTALRAANPHWGGLAKLPAGTLVIVPNVPGVNAAAAQPVTAVSPDVIAQLKQALADANAVLEQSFASTTQEIETSVSLTKSRDLAALVKQAPELRTLMAQIAGQSKLQIKQIKAAKTAQLQCLAQLEEDLGSLNP
jgi:hypothetical protein